MPAPTRRLVSAPRIAPAPFPVDGGIPPNEKTYHTKLNTAWPHAPRIEIEIEIQGAPEAQDVRIPLEFVQSSGVDAWSLVRHMLSTLVNEAGQLWDSTDTLVDLGGKPEAGRYFFARVEGDGDGPSFTWRQGPTGFRKGQAADKPESDDSSSISASSIDQVHPVRSFLSGTM